jgi:hypothetical protein
VNITAAIKTIDVNILPILFSIFSSIVNFRIHRDALYAIPTQSQ